jgi:hypothetical protein
VGEKGREMKPDDILKLNELCQQQAQETKSIGAQEMGLLSLQCSLLAEIAARISEINENMKVILNPPIIYDTSKFDPVEFPEQPNSIITVMQPRLTLRDQFAMAALAGLLSDPTSSGPKGCAEAAYSYATAMMEARKK